MNKINTDIFKRYTSGHFSTEDERQVRSCLSDDQLVAETQVVLTEDWDTTTGDDQNKEQLNHILYRLNYQINTQQKNNQKSNRKRLLRFMTTAAAIILPIFFWVGYRYYISYNNESRPATAQIIAPTGSRVQFTLPDGTTGWLNGGSTLDYTIEFAKRSVQIEGEGFFDVIHDSQHPFEVTGPDSKVVVLGTRFNVTMWPNETITEVVLESGKVQFSFDGEAASTLLAPGQRLIFDRQKRNVKIEKVLVENHLDWMEGQLVFRGDDMCELAERLGKWYNVEVLIKDDCLNDYRFRATFKNESLQEVLGLLKMTSPIDFEIIDSQQMKDGSFSRKKVVLKMINTE